MSESWETHIIIIQITCLSGLLVALQSLHIGATLGSIVIECSRFQVILQLIT